MKLFTLAAAALVAITGFAPGVAAPAEAQRTVVQERTVVRTGPGYRTRTTTIRRGPGYRGRAYYRGGRRYTRTVCTNRWRYGRRVRVCRQVRR